MSMIISAPCRSIGHMGRDASVTALFRKKPPICSTTFLILLQAKGVKLETVEDVLTKRQRAG